MEILMVLLFLYLIIVITGYILVIYRHRKKHKEEMMQDHTLLEIIISKNIDEEPRGPLAAEQVFSNLHSIFRKTNVLLRWLEDIQPRISFEIVHHDHLIHFYAWVRNDLKELVESQIYAQYPDVEIYERQDYKSLVTSKKHLVSATLTLLEPYIFPIKKYKQFEDAIAKKSYDSLSGIVSSLSKLNDADDIAMVQIIFSPITDEWHKKGIKDIQFIQKHSSLSKLKQYWLKWRTTHTLVLTLIAILIFPIFFLWKIINLFIPKDNTTLEELERLKRGEEIRDDTVRNSLLGKIAKLGFCVSIKVTYATDIDDKRKIDNKIKEIAGSFKQFNLPHLNGFYITRMNRNKTLILEKCFERKMDAEFILNTEELATIFHLPINSVDIPNIQIITSKSLPPPLTLP
jgi:hypothetical protein